ncbi:MAG: tRNA guanosine(34) transglycosylase Tgt [Deltaproteobacteria bacterium]|jgi:queuine tRNA-ribosyltransferase|nr:tRNA guanosine(34) transglycosylase Tgt [Deltaproteobacteria bacterium]
MSHIEHFSVTERDPSSKARCGHLVTAHGQVETPLFMPVGTRAAVKGLAPDDLERLGATIVLSNTFHLMLRPGAELINSLGGIHRFMGWKGPILTDSGGFQVHSLAKLRKITEEGVTFSSPYNGDKVVLTPERAVEVQTLLGVDIMMALDECTAYPATREEAISSMELTYAWAKRSQAAWNKDSGQMLFGISQGGVYPDLRVRSASELASLELPGYAAGGLALGEPREIRLEAIEASFSALPEDRPRYLMGMGTPLDILDGIRLGADMFDCVLPTRNARNGQLFTHRGPLNLNNARYKSDPLPPEEGCACYTCQNFSRAYLRHLHQNREPLFIRLGTLHNLHFYFQLIHKARKSLKTGSYLDYYKEFFSSYAHGDPAS